MGFSGPYGVYHSTYDDMYWMTHFGDPTFAYHKGNFPKKKMQENQVM